MKNWLQLVCGLAAIIFAGLLVQPAFAQREYRRQQRERRPPAQRPFHPPPEKPRDMQPPRGRPNARGMMGLPPKWVENLRNMSPEEQQRFMQNDARFRNLPPERQEQVRRTMANWNRLTPEQRDAIRARERVFNRLTPEEKAEVQTDLLPRWQKLPQNRRELIQGRLRVLGSMTPEERQQKLNDPDFMRGLNPDEQDMLRKLSDLRLGPAVNPGQ